MAYCRWLAEVVGKSVTLPSEAQWEKAARGHDDQREYPWEGAWIDGYCNTFELGLGGTTPVGIFPEGISPYGCLDMAGNVWEWMSTQYRDYEYKADDGGENLDAADDVGRVLRGGSWLDYQFDARCSIRYRFFPDHRLDFFGFRIVVSPIF